LGNIAPRLDFLGFFMGADKIYGDNEKYDNPFYTGLKPWNKTASDTSNLPGS
jgi:hypothetical protein